MALNQLRVKFPGEQATPMPWLPRQGETWVDNGKVYEVEKVEWITYRPQKHPEYNPPMVGPTVVLREPVVNMAPLKLAEDRRYEAQTAQGIKETATKDATEAIRRAEAAEAKLTKQQEEAQESCREELGPDHEYRKCGEPAEFILWGKLIEPEGLGPRCYDHAAKHVGHPALGYHSGYAIFDLRPFKP